MIAPINIAVSIVPVFVFLTILILLDSYKLVKLPSILLTIAVGIVVAIVCYFLNRELLGFFHLDLTLYSKYIAPPIEEFLKTIYIYYLFRRKKIGFLVDAAIYGFAMGAGFACIENIYYLHIIQNSNVFIWIIRGFGTAIMHGGTIALFAIISKHLTERSSREPAYVFLPGLFTAIFIHACFNHLFFPAIVTTIIQLTVLPVLIVIFFIHSEANLRDWLEVGLETDVHLLDYIHSGTIKETKVGSYLYSLKSRFSGEVVADMLCYLRIHLELAIRAKGLLIMHETGFSIPPDPNVRDKFKELKYLENSIGKTGKLAMSPILNNTTRDLWQLYLLDKK